MDTAATAVPTTAIENMEWCIERAVRNRGRIKSGLRGRNLGDDNVRKLLGEYDNMIALLWRALASLEEVGVVFEKNEKELIACCKRRDEALHVAMTLLSADALAWLAKHSDQPPPRDFQWPILRDGATEWPTSC